MPRQPRRGPKPAPPEPEKPDPADPYISPQELRAIYLELAQRKVESLNLYEPLPIQNDFHQSKALERVVWGSNRSGKTLSTHVELARAVLGRDPFEKYPKIDGRAFLVGYRGQEIGEVNYRKLFRPGPFKIIRDPKTKQWRSYRPWEAFDAENRQLARPAPPLIPHRYHQPIAWENKKAMIPSSVKFHNGWELNFFSSQGVPPSGSDIDLAVFDEEMESPLWYPEVSARLADREGRFVWGATPQRGTEQLYDLCMAAEDLHAKRVPNPRVVEFKLLLDKNPHMTESAKTLLKEKYADDHMQYSMRIEGEFAIVSFKFYPEFHRDLHGIDSFPVPADWTRYAVVDPGHQPCSVLFIATPPKESPYHPQRIVYDELVIPNCNAVIFGQRMGVECVGQAFQAFIIDSRAGKITDMGSGLNLESQYSAALKANKVASASTGYGFVWGNDNFEAGVSSVRTWLQIGKDAKPTMLYFKDVVREFQNQMERYHYKRDATSVTDKPVKKRDHLCFVAGTMIATEAGAVPIENVKVGDMVWTRDGLRPVSASAMTGQSEPVMELETQAGRLTATADHPIFVDGIGFVAVDCLRYGDRLLVCENQSNAKLSSSATSNSGDTQIRSAGRIGCTLRQTGGIEKEAWVGSTRKSGKRLMDRSPKGGIFTTRITTPSTTHSTTSNVLPSLTTGGITESGSRQSSENILHESAPLPSHGTGVRKGENGTHSIPEKFRPTRLKSNLFANDATSRTEPRSLPEGEVDSAHSLAKPLPGEPPGSIMSSDIAESAKLLSPSTDTRRLRIVQTFVRGVRVLSNPQAVYSLTVDGTPEFFANGILVHNCDCLRYGASFGCPYIKPHAAKVKEQESKAAKAIRAKKKRKKDAAGGDYVNLGPGV